MQTEFVTDFRSLEAIADDWDRLWRTDSRQTVFGRFAWARASWRAYGSKRKLCTLLVRRGQTICGILPLATVDHTLQFLGADRSDYNDLLADPELGDQIVTAAFRALGRAPASWNRCVLANIPEHSMLAQRFSQQKHVPGVRVHLSFAALCPCVELDADRDATLAAILRKKSLRRHEQKLGRLGPLSFRHIEDRAEAQSHLPELFRQHIARWGMSGQQSLFQDHATCVFYERLLDEFDLKRELRFGVLMVGDRPVAYHLGFETNGTFYWYKPTFDISLRDYSPGEVLIRKLFEYVRDRGLACFDFTVGSESFKSRFANRVAKNYTLHVFPAGARGTARRLALRARDRLKRHPTVFRHASSLSARLSRALSPFIER